MSQDNQATEIFSTEIDGWCYGLAQYPGEIFDGLVYRVIVEMRPVFEKAIHKEVTIDLKQVVRKFREASKFLVPEKEIAQCIIKQLPDPAAIGEGPQYAVATVLDQAERDFGVALEEVERFWARERRKLAA